MIHQGEVYWIPLEPPGGSEPGHLRPGVILQNDVANQSRIQTVIVCLLTSNLRRATAPGNVLLERGEAGLDRPSVANVSQIFTIDKDYLGARIGRLSSRRVEQILLGVFSFLTPRGQP